MQIIYNGTTYRFPTAHCRDDVYTFFYFVVAHQCGGSFTLADLAKHGAAFSQLANPNVVSRKLTDIGMLQRAITRGFLSHDNGVFTYRA